MIPIELISGAIGAIGGFAMKAYALKMQTEADRFNRMLSAIKATDDSADRAVARVPNDKAGNYIRRLIVLAILFGVILAPFILAMMNKPLTVEVDSPVKTWLFGFLSSGGKPVFYEINSYLLIPEVRQSLIALIGFYFGQSAAKR
jgi:hypothetical protein